MNKVEKVLSISGKQGMMVKLYCSSMALTDQKGENTNFSRHSEKCEP